MQKIVVLGDIHLQSNETRGRGNTILNDKLDSIREFVDYCLDNDDINLVVLLGDVFDRLNPSQLLRSMFLDAIEPLIGSHKTIVWIMGNHDTNFINTTLHKEISILGKANNMYYVDKLHSVKHVIYAPYGVASEELTTGKILFTHNSIEKGLVGFYDKPLNEVEYVAEDLRHYELVIAGHYHKPHDFKLGNTKVLYVGSTTVIDFAERNEEKRFIVVDVDTQNIKSIPFSVKRKFIQFDVEEPQKPDEIVTASRLRDLKNSIVKIKFIGSNSWYSSIDHIGLQRMLYELGANDYTPDKEITDIGVDVTFNTAGLNKSELLDKFIKEEGIDEKRAQIGIDLMEEASKESE